MSGIMFEKIKQLKMNKASFNIFMTLNLLIVGVSIADRVSAASLIAVPEEIVLLSINDQELKGSFIRTDKDYKVDPGPVSLVLRYQEYFEQRNDQHDILKSANIHLNIEQLLDQHRYQLKLIDPPQDFDAAKIYAQHPTVALFDENNRIVAQETGSKSAEKTWLSNGFLSRSIDTTQSNKTSKAQIANTTSSKQSVEQTSQTQMKDIREDTTSSKALPRDQQLIQLWQKASKLERQKFMTWLTE